MRLAWNTLCATPHRARPQTRVSVEAATPAERASRESLLEERFRRWQKAVHMIGADVTIVPGKVDGCEVIGETGGNGGAPIRAGALLLATGWIIAADSPIEQVWVSVDEIRCAPGSKGYERIDVAEAYPRPDARFSGFRVILTVDGLSAGRHTLTAEAIDVDGRFLRADGPPYEFEIEEGDGVDVAAVVNVEYVTVDGEDVDKRSPITIGPDSVLALAGWAVSADDRAGIAALLRGDRLLALDYGLERPDLAALYGDAALSAGFEGTFTAEALASAGKRLEVVMIPQDGRSLLGSDAVLQIDVVENVAPRRTLRLKNT